MDRDKPSNAKQKGIGRIRSIALPVVTILVFLLIWQIIVELGLVASNVLAGPIKVLTTFVAKFVDTKPEGHTMPIHILVSLEVTLSGLCLAIIIGVPLGLLMGWYRGVSRFAKPLFEIIRPIPPIAWIPITILWMGVGLPAKALIIFFAAFVPCVINSYTGIQQTNLTLINVAKTYGATNFQMFMRVGIPSAMPMAFGGIRIALSNAWMTLVAAELLAANAGLGFMISMGRNFARPDIIILGMLTIGALGYLLTTIFEKVEDRVVRWRTV